MNKIKHVAYSDVKASQTHRVDKRQSVPEYVLRFGSKQNDQIDRDIR